MTTNRFRGLPAALILGILLPLTASAQAPSPVRLVFARPGVVAQQYNTTVYALDVGMRTTLPVTNGILEEMDKGIRMPLAYDPVMDMFLGTLQLNLPNNGSPGVKIRVGAMDNGRMVWDDNHGAGYVLGAGARHGAVGGGIGLLEAALVPALEPGRSNDLVGILLTDEAVQPVGARARVGFTKRGIRAQSRPAVPLGPVGCMPAVQNCQAGDIHAWEFRIPLEDGTFDAAHPLKVSVSCTDSNGIRRVDNFFGLRYLRW